MISSLISRMRRVFTESLLRGTVKLTTKDRSWRIKIKSFKSSSNVRSENLMIENKRNRSIVIFSAIECVCVCVRVSGWGGEGMNCWNGLSYIMQ